MKNHGSTCWLSNIFLDRSSLGEVEGCLNRMCRFWPLSWFSDAGTLLPLWALRAFCGESERSRGLSTSSSFSLLFLLFPLSSSRWEAPHGVEVALRGAMRAIPSRWRRWALAGMSFRRGRRDRGPSSVVVVPGQPRRGPFLWGIGSGSLGRSRRHVSATTAPSWPWLLPSESTRRILHYFFTVLFKTLRHLEAIT